ncbi:MAG TPA: hypothetical protein VMM78_02940 [Thermomicrobiales bacterium]|nr:hypothetical protein [Thermomicrobiales bacterium]
MNVRRRGLLALAAAVALLATSSALTTYAIVPGSDPFQRTWARADAPVTDGQAARTWVWGPEAFTAAMFEPYADSPGGARVVQYFDKARMEITRPNGDRTSGWHVTNGLLVVELVSGMLQSADNAFEQREPAHVNVAGDPDDPDGPTYATFAALRSAPPAAEGATITARLARDGAVTDDAALAVHGVTATERVQDWAIDHRVASVFWDYINSEGAISVGGRSVNGRLFPDAWYATGLPISEAYWTTVRVLGAPQDVLVQCFERRCLTWTPTNDPGWQVEMGNVGRHYFVWRYGIDVPAEAPPVDPGSDPLPATPLDAWDVNHNGLIYFRMSNQTPYALTMTVDGPISVVFTIPPCEGCVVYPRAQPPLACRDDTPSEEALLPPGNFRVQVEYSAPHADRPAGHWTLTPDTALDTCWVLVER